MRMRNVHANKIQSLLLPKAKLVFILLKKNFELLAFQRNIDRMDDLEKNAEDDLVKLCFYFT